MSDLSPSEALEPLENSPTTHAHVANTEDLTPEDWETLMDEETNEETKSDKDDVNKSAPSRRGPLGKEYPLYHGTISRNSA